MLPSILHLWPKSLWIPGSNTLSRQFDFVDVIRGILAADTIARLITVSTLSEALTVHFEAFGLGTLAGEVLHRR